MASSILISGLINLETTVRVDGFPIVYRPVRYPFFGVNSTIAGVGFNLAKALTGLGNRVHLASLVGRDPAGRLAYAALGEAGIPAGYVLDKLAHTAQSVILYDPAGARQIFVDLKTIQEEAYPTETMMAAWEGCSLVVLCNINFSRPFLGLAAPAGKLVASDVHAIASLDDDYNRDFMAAADILFMSHEQLPCSPEVWVRQLWGRYPAGIVVIGLGAGGALLAVRQDNFVERVAAVYTRPVVNTIGAGDALLAAFLHSYHQDHNPYTAIQTAMIFASYKIGATGAAEGFLDQTTLHQLISQEYQL